ncbi:phosphatase family protein [Cordyceps fumosorosea ARSEF 2679]|uniref:Phosphatase family protein n=1 Tax=Cordyceps fumosorosea (strain ARSEF 2679) TaxID=1081104 RepID=A0A167I8B4_CORFA|nr:phosphatase family protein [Cordyceps fumosorosea ARSEF 2679]OAA48781.1 phosphatase family protein [Cordyceps fumosorosea ARSEF 2679]
MQTARGSSVRSEPSDIGDASLSTPHSLARALTLRRSEYMGQRQLRVKIGSWNTAGCPGTDRDVGSWFFRDQGLARDFSNLTISSAKADEPNDTGAIDLYVLGLQEVVDLNTTKEYVSRVYAESNSQITKWRSAVEAAIPAGYEFLSADQMVGLLTLVYASTDTAKHISNVSTQQIGTGLLGYFGNKGAVATRIVFGETTRMVFVNSHLASGAGPSYLDRRCWDVAQIASKMQFDPVVNNGVAEDTGDRFGDEDFTFWLGDLNFRLGSLPGDDIRRILTLHTRGEYDVGSDKPQKPLDGEPFIIMNDVDSDEETTTASSFSHSREQSFDSETSLPDPDDFPQDPSQDPASLQATLDSLLPHDQLRQVIARRKAFHEGWKEGPITFLPTYKYDVGSVALFDTSEKRRAPSWCDRILYRTRQYKEEYERKMLDEEAAKKKDEEMKSRGMESDDDVLFSYDPDEDGGEQEPVSSTDTGYQYDEYDENDDQPDPASTVKERANLEFYTSYQRVTSSDHKPLSSVFTLTCDCVIPEEKAKVHAEVARQLDRAENEGRPVITLVLEGDATQDTNVVDLGGLSFLARKSNSITIANTGGVPATFSFIDRPAMDDSDSGTHFYEWLAASFVKSDGSGEVVGPNVMLEPGETVTAVLDGQVSSIPFLRALNDGRALLEEVLVLRVDNGRDHFITVRGQWLPSCFGRSIDELIRVPEGGICRFLEDKDICGAIPYDAAVHCSAPRELFKLTEAVQALAERCAADADMLGDTASPPTTAGWPFDPGACALGADEKQAVHARIVAALDTDAAVADVLPAELAPPNRLELVASALLLFIASLTDGLVPAHACARLATALPTTATLPRSDAKVAVLDVLSASPNHSIALVLLTSTLARVASELTPATPTGLQRRLSFRRGAPAAAEGRRRRYAEVLAPLAFRSGADGGRDRAARERERATLELFLGPETRD